MSPVLVSNTGAPQDCVLSSFLYTLYANDCRSVDPSTQFMRFSDDTAMFALLSDFVSYQSSLFSVVRFSSWCSKQFCYLGSFQTEINYVVIELSLVLFSSTVNLWNRLIVRISKCSP